MGFFSCYGKGKMVHKKTRNMQVVLRIRPFRPIELEQCHRKIFRVVDRNTIIFDPDANYYKSHCSKRTHRDISKPVQKNMTMRFDQVFDTHETNHDIFAFSMRPLIAWLMDGYNCSAFVYGSTGAGKTFIMLGNAQNLGLTYLTIEELFKQIQANSDKQNFDIRISYVEVYNEQVKNLLKKGGPLRLREDESGVTVRGLELKQIFNADELLSLLAFGNRNRTQHPTDANAGKRAVMMFII